VRTFFDTNILIYADDLAAGGKRERALAILEEHVRGGTAVVSTQVLQEFYVIATRKLGVSAAVARHKVELFGRLDLVEVDLELILGAIDVQRLHQLSFWDALIVHAAAVAGCSVLLSEDLQDGRVIDGLRISNPLQI
jgi:predicted nucleic acid-binding protein